MTSPGELLRVTTFNIRYGTAADGSNSWPNRRELVRDVIRETAPDVLGTQEVLDFQIDYLRQELAAYDCVGVGRDDGKRRGEFAAIFFRRERFDLNDCGHFWLSETPEVPGSQSWGTSQTRIVTWCRLADRERGDSPVVFFNTHFDNRTEEARIRSAELLRQRFAPVAAHEPVVVTGDFNATWDSAEYTILRDGGEVQLFDAYCLVHSRADANELTRHGFTGSREGSRIDWILHSDHFTAEAAEIVRWARNGRFPSDHYPVTATLRAR